jgi:TBC1 domain family protein 5
MQSNHSKLGLNNKRKHYSIRKGVELINDLINKDHSYSDLIEHSLDDRLLSETRSLYWKIFLEILPIKKINSWHEITKNYREQYRKKRENYITSEISLAFKSMVSPSNIPGLNENDQYNLNIIILDVIRTYQEIDLFRNAKTLESLSELLYIWTKENNEMTYIQGMNEIIGTIYYALFPCIIHETNFEKEVDNSVNNLYLYLNFEEGFDADIYLIFGCLMEKCLKKLFDYSNQSVKLKHNSAFFDKSSLTLDGLSKLNNLSSIKKRILRIFYCFLKLADKELFEFLNEFFEPDLFMFRWVLCLLNREVGLKECVYFWDAIFAMEFHKTIRSSDPNESILENDLSFLDFLCVALLVNLKDRIINNDDINYILQSLMYYPSDFVAKDIVKSAHKIRGRILNMLR